MTATPRSVVRLLFVPVIAATLVAGCSSDDSPATVASSIVSPDSVAPDSAGPAETDLRPIAEAGPDLHIVASLGYPRDLRDRGRLNLEVDRADDVPMTVIDKRLVTDFFEPAAVELRRSVIPTEDHIVALQTLFGTVDDCDDPGSVSAVLELTYLYGDDPEPRTGSFPLADATTLDTIRFQECTMRRVVETTSIEFGTPVVADETMTVDVTITRLDGRDELGFDSIKGTVLFGAATPFTPGSPQRTLAPDQASLTIPLTFDVNRCDAHAVAETTKKYGLDFYVSVDGAESQRVPVPIDPIRADLETMLDRCTVRTGE